MGVEVLLVHGYGATSPSTDLDEVVHIGRMSVEELGDPIIGTNLIDVLETYFDDP